MLTKSIHSLRNRVNDVSSVLNNEVNLSLVRDPRTYYYALAAPEGVRPRVIFISLIITVRTADWVDFLKVSHVPRKTEPIADERRTRRRRGDSRFSVRDSCNFARLRLVEENDVSFCSSGLLSRASFVSLCIYPSIYLLIHQSIYLSIYLYLSIFPFIYPRIHISIYIFIT